MPRRLVLVLVVGLLVALAMTRDGEREAATAATVPKGVAECLRLSGDPARQCFRREVGRQLAAVSGREYTDVAGTVQFDVRSNATAELLCDIHLRAGTGEGEAPSWLRRWGTAPQTVGL